MAVGVRGPRPQSEAVLITGVNVEWVQAYRYLEVQLDGKLPKQAEKPVHGLLHPLTQVVRLLPAEQKQSGNSGTLKSLMNYFFIACFLK